MNPISQIELNAHFKDLEREVGAARQSQGAVLGWLRELWRRRRSGAAPDAKATAPQDCDRQGRNRLRPLATARP